MNTNQWLKIMHDRYDAIDPIGKTHGHVVDYAICKDGFRISIQASRLHWCTPQSNDGPWTHVECAYPSMDTPELKPHRDGESGVFGQVSVEVLDAVLMQHGGIVK